METKPDVWTKMYKRALSSSLHMITKKIPGGKKTAKCFHLSHTKGIFLSPSLYSQHQVLILPLAMILIFSSPRLRPAPSVQQCCLYLFHSAWDIWVSVNRFPSPAPTAGRQAYRSLAFAGESHLLLNFPLPLPLLLFFSLSSQSKQWILPLHPQAVILPLPNMFLHEAFNQVGRLFCPCAE